MHILIVCLSLFVLVSGDSTKHYILKHPGPQPAFEPANPPVDSKPHDSVGATYQAITKRHHSGVASSSTTAEILNTISSPHSRSSVSFTTTSVDHSPSETVVHSTPHGEHPTTPGSYIAPHHAGPVAPASPKYYEVPTVHVTPSPKYEGPTVHPIAHSSQQYNEAPTVHTVLHHDYAKLHAAPHQAVPSVHTSPSYHEAPVVHASHYPQYPPAPSQHYQLQHIVNDPGVLYQETSAPTYIYRIPPNQIDGYPPTPRVAPKAFNYQPVLTLSNNIKSFYKINAYTPFVVPPNYSDDYLSNLVYPGGELYKSYAGGYTGTYAGNVVKVFPGPVVSYNVTAAPYEPSPHYSSPPLPSSPYPSPSPPASPHYVSPPLPSSPYPSPFPPASPHYPSPPLPSSPYPSPSPPVTPSPLSLPPPPGLSLIQGVSKPYKDNAYLEPPRALFTPVLVYKKYSP